MAHMLSSKKGIGDGCCVHRPPVCEKEQAQALSPKALGWGGLHEL